MEQETIGADVTARRPHDDVLPHPLPDGLNPQRPVLRPTCLFPLPMESPVLYFKEISEIRIHGERDVTGSRLLGVIVDSDVLQDSGPQLATADNR